MKGLLTLDDLYEFYTKQNKTCTFSSEESKSTIVVSVNENMTFSKEYDPDSYKLKTHLKACHLFENRNKSSISEESMKQAIPSFYNSPIMGYIHQLKNGSWDFAGHEIEYDENGNSIYREIPVGVIPESCNAQLVYDEENDKTYLEVDGLIYKEYSKAAEILEEKETSKVSVEIAVDELSFDADKKILNIDKFHFLGVTILGVTDDEEERVIQEGMQGSNITIADFSAENNSNITKLLQELSDKIDNLSSYTNEKKSKEGGQNQVNKFEELLQKYNKTVEDITFAYDGLSDEELEAAFAEAFDEPKKKIEDDDTPAVPEAETPDEDEKEIESEPEQEPVEPETENEPNSDINVETNSLKYEFALSLADKQYAAYCLINDTYSEMDNDYYSVDVYEDSKEIVMHGLYSGKHYRQAYKVKSDVYSLKGDRIEVFAQYLTQDEISKLDSMKANYEEISEKLAKYEAEPEKLEILESDEYSSISDKEEFIELKKQKNHFDLSIDELKKSADDIILNYAKKGSLTFSVIEEEHKSVGRKTLPTNKKVSKRSRYGGFGKKED